MIEKIFNSIILMYTFIVLAYTLFIKFKKTYINIKLSLCEAFNYRLPIYKNQSESKIKLSKKDLKYIFSDIFIIKSKQKRDIIILLFSLSTIIITNNTPIKDKIPSFIFVIFSFLFFFGLAKFFRFSTNSFLVNLSNLFIKWCILLIFIFTLLESIFKTSFNIFNIIFTILFSIIFSLILISSVLTDFNKRWFQIINIFTSFIVILIVTGLSLGIYYLEYNDIFNLYTRVEIEKLNANYQSGIINYIIVIYKGLIHFYSFPTNVTLDQPETLILFFEYLLGFVFNVVVIGFLISYFVSIISNKRNYDQESYFM